MAMLKKGSKGRPVETLQNAVNKLGIKPELNVDGIFGPLTEKGVRAAQKKLKLNSDGKAGDLTLAAIKYGKPLPEMTVPDVKKSLLGNEAAVGNLSKIEQNHKTIVDGKTALDKALLNVTNDMSVATKMDLTSWKRIIDEQRKIYDAQKKFDAILIKNPDEAAKLARTAETQQIIVKEMYKTLHKSASTMRTVLATERKAMIAQLKAMDSAMQEAQKLYSDTLKKMS
ncbi:MAG: peptidoglycan-binding protein [Pseudomonadota bacterium]